MGIRPAKCYRSLKDRAYCRSAVKKHSKNFIGGVPGIKIRQYNSGNGAAKFKNVIDLKVDNQWGGGIIIRDNAIESIRIMITKHLTDKLKKEGFFIKIRTYPHHFLRENKQAQGAGADRISTGMSHSFGRVIGRGCRLKDGQTILSVLVHDDQVEFAKSIVKRAHYKLPCNTTIIHHKDVKSVGTRPKKVKLTKAEKRALVEGKAEAAEKDIKDAKDNAAKPAEKNAGAKKGTA